MIINEQTCKEEIKAAKKRILATIKRRSNRNPNLTLGEVADRLWENLRKLDQPDEYHPDPKLDRKRYAVIRAMNHLGISPTSKTLATDYLKQK